MNNDDLDDRAEVNFIYSGYGRHVNFYLKDEDADYLPRLLTAFAEYLRACGFTYVDVEETKGGYLFHKNFDSKTSDDTWSRPEFSELFGLSDDEEDEEEQSEINQAAEDYWDTTVDDANLEEGIEPGDTVYYHGKGTPETTLNQREEPQGHGGINGISLVNMLGKTIKISDTPVGTRVLVKWNNWHDGHNGMGDDPDAKMSDRNYWWSNIDNLSLSN